MIIDLFEKILLLALNICLILLSFLAVSGILKKMRNTNKTNIGTSKKRKSDLQFRPFSKVRLTIRGEMRFAIAPPIITPIRFAPLFISEIYPVSEMVHPIMTPADI